MVLRGVVFAAAFEQSFSLHTILIIHEIHVRPRREACGIRYLRRLCVGTWHGDCGVSCMVGCVGPLRTAHVVFDSDSYMTCLTTSLCRVSWVPFQFPCEKVSVSPVLKVAVTSKRDRSRRESRCMSAMTNVGERRVGSGWGLGRRCTRETTPEARASRAGWRRQKDASPHARWGTTCVAVGARDSGYGVSADRGVAPRASGPAGPVRSPLDGGRCAAVGLLARRLGFSIHLSGKR